MYNSNSIWSSSIREDHNTKNSQNSFLIGVLDGEGSGPEIISCCLDVLNQVSAIFGHEFTIQKGGEIGVEVEKRLGKSLSKEVIHFCNDIFNNNGAILSGAGGGRFVYDLRKHFDLFCKIVPIKPIPELKDYCRIKDKHIRQTDIILIRENASGIYQGKSKEKNNNGKEVSHSFVYRESEVRRIIEVSCRLAARRKQKLMVVLKDGGLPLLSDLWRDITNEISSSYSLEVSYANIDYAAYLLIQEPQDMDVIVAPDLFADVLADLGGTITGARGITYSGNYSPDRKAVYQTNHGGAHDLKGKNQVNPVGQIFSLAMLLRESFNLVQESNLIENAVASTWKKWRTQDLPAKGKKILGTKEITEKIIAEMQRIGSQNDYCLSAS